MVSSVEKNVGRNPIGNCESINRMEIDKYGDGMKKIGRNPKCDRDWCEKEM